MHLQVPSKLLIQIPRYEGGFKTYQKLIPGLKLKVKRLVCSTSMFAADIQAFEWSSD